MEGILNVFKPKGMSSHDVVNIIRRKFNMKRVGHTGTLDPDVTGVLPICIGRATRVSEYILNADKTYIGELTLGYKTDTQDYSGRVTKTSEKEVTDQQIRETFKLFEGIIQQIPPMYSAVRYKGKRLHELARKDIKVERKSREVEIYNLDILDINKNKILFRVECSKGTYIRTLCNDIGEFLGTYGYLSFLMRIQVDDFKIKDSLGIDTINNMSLDSLDSFIKPMDLALKNLYKVNLDDSYYKRLSNGVRTKIDPITGNNLYNKEEIRVYIENNFLGIGKILQEDEEFFIKMTKVLKFR